VESSSVRLGSEFVENFSLKAVLLGNVLKS
jgi:hypothetical protein